MNLLKEDIKQECSSSSTHVLNGVHGVHTYTMVPV
mgnify:CR=1 FL=1